MSDRIDVIADFDETNTGYVWTRPDTGEDATQVVPATAREYVLAGGTATIPLRASDDPDLSHPIRHWMEEHIDGAANPVRYAITVLRAGGSPQYLSVLRAAALATPPPAPTTFYTPLTTFNAHAATIGEPGVLGHVQVSGSEGAIGIDPDTGRIIVIPAYTLPIADSSPGAIGTDPLPARGDHSHPLSSAYATSGHTHTAGAPAAHASSHAAGGSDPLTPGAIGAATAANLISEASTRAADDAALAGLINSEASTRAGVDTALGNSIATNTTNISSNTAAIATNTANISTNTANIATNTSNLATETTNRIAGDLRPVVAMFTNDTSLYLRLPYAVTLAAPTTAPGTATFAYASALSATPTSFSTVTFPHAFAAGDWLRVTATGVVTSDSATFTRTA